MYNSYQIQNPGAYYSPGQVPVYGHSDTGFQPSHYGHQNVGFVPEEYLRQPPVYNPSAPEAVNVAPLQHAALYTTGVRPTPVPLETASVQENDQCCCLRCCTYLVVALALAIMGYTLYHVFLKK